MAKWVLDPGHGGDDSGAIGINGRKECDIVLEAVLEAKKHLERNGENVLLTRDIDISIESQTRASIANNWGADYFVSFHMNSVADNLITGTEIFLLEKGDKTEKLAKFIRDEVLSNLKSDDRGIKEATDDVLININIPSVLIKADFLSNEEVENNFNSKKYGYMVAKGCLAMVDKVLLETPITKAKPPASKAWRICVGYYKDYNEVQNALEDAKRNGIIDAYIVPYEG
ncbi:MAG: N-acetylmuramoyl-L-alanine amidase family protein [Clostridium sp.]